MLMLPQLLEESCGHDSFDDVSRPIPKPRTSFRKIDKSDLDTDKDNAGNL